MSASCAYEGWVRHRRYGAVEHELRRELFMLFLDLDELPELFDGVRGFSARRAAPAWFRRGDHFGDPARSLSDCVRELVAQRTATVAPQGPIRLLTHLRYLGHCFNPVSFYYCYDATGARVQAVVAEVTNTPWGDRHCYVLGTGDQDTGVLQGRLAKELHVSPFMGMEQTYDWRISTPGEELHVQIANEEHDAVVFDATLALERRALAPGTLERLALKHPAITLRVSGAIYHEAWRLWRKRAPYHARPAQAAR